MVENNNFGCWYGPVVIASTLDLVIVVSNPVRIFKMIMKCGMCASVFVYVSILKAKKH